MDRAQLAIIEFSGNPIEIYEDDARKKSFEQKDKPTFWEWEMKILQQEKEFYEQEILTVSGLNGGEVDTKEEASKFDIIEDTKEDQGIFNSLTFIEVDQATNVNTTDQLDYMSHLTKSPVISMTPEMLMKMSEKQRRSVKHLERQIHRVDLDIDVHLKDKKKKRYGNQYESVHGNSSIV
jgi:hypothetical protein